MIKDLVRRIPARAPALLFLALLLLHVHAAQSRASSVLPPEAAGLESFFKALRDLEAGRLDGPLYILHIGDSHTAGGWFPNRLRERFQAKFGNGGRGLLAAGLPFRWYHPGGVRVTQSEGWKVFSSFDRRPRGPFGLPGFRASGDDPEDVMTLESGEAGPFRRVEVEMVTGPENGGLSIRIDDQEPREFSSRAPQVKARRISLEMDPPGRRVELSPVGDGPVELLSWNVEKGGPGIVYDSHGIVGATVEIIGRWSPQVVSWQLKHRPPKLIVIEYGGNEGFHDDLEAAEYAAAYRTRIRFLQKAAPGASLLLLGPSDGARLPSYCARLEKERQKKEREERRKNKEAGDKNKKNEPPEEKVYDCRPLTDLETARYDEMIRRQDPDLCRWHAPPKLAVVRETQRRVALEEGWPYWDWSTLMEGECGIHDWVEAEPSLAAWDHVHLQKSGYKLSADTLFEILMDYYRYYRKVTGK